MRSRHLTIAVLLLSPGLLDGLTAQSNRRDSLSQFGITWTFDKKHKTGQYANGDWWVVGPVKIVKIDPPSVSGGRIMNGSQLNPRPKLGNVQGYDSSMHHNRFDVKLNVALDVSESKPLTVPPNSSLVSTISVRKPKDRPQVRGASVLTVVAKPAKPGDFRPAYCGSDKSTKFNVAQLKTQLLKRLKPAGKTPALASVERMFERVWLEHMPHWMGKYLHPKDNMQFYGRNLASDTGIGALMLHLDFSVARKKTLLIRMVQLGIDRQGVADTGGHRNWIEAGGHNQGRKWPILFAGLMLGDQHMTNVGTQDVWFQEDRQCYYVTQADIDRLGHPQDDLGRPMWGIHHTRKPADDKQWGKNNYQMCCTANSIWGHLLAAYIMDARELWNCEVLFDYADRYRGSISGAPRWVQGWDAWTLQMWDAYRGVVDKTVRLRVASGAPSGSKRTRAPSLVRLNWNMIPLRGARGYRVYRGRTAKNMQLLEKDVRNSFFTDSKAGTGKTWFYAVSVVDQKGKELARSVSVKVKS